jgi:hypothetical protein
MIYHALLGSQAMLRLLEGHILPQLLYNRPAGRVSSISPVYARCMNMIMMGTPQMCNPRTENDTRSTICHIPRNFPTSPPATNWRGMEIYLLTTTVQNASEYPVCQ